jgi:hypothetical protein
MQQRVNKVEQFQNKSTLEGFIHFMIQFECGRYF